MLFKDRFEAGQELAKKLQHFKNKNGIVVAIPRGGIQTGYAVAMALDLPLEVVLTKKLGHPAHKEFAIGAVSMDDRIITSRYEVTDEYIEQETHRIRDVLKDRHDLYYPNRQPMSFTDHIVIIVDDGVATGSTLLATIELIKKSRPAKIVVAVPVSSPRALEKLEATVDEVICLWAPEKFMAVGQHYASFAQVSDAEVVELLEAAHEKKQGESK